jgi:CheY-like chemotaxis protein
MMQKVKILVVDDEAIVRESLSDWLKDNPKPPGFCTANRADVEACGYQPGYRTGLGHGRPSSSTSKR